MDGSANPYLLQAGVLAAGIEGINKKINPGKPLHCNMYTDYKKYPKLAKLPNDVGQALGMLEKSKMLNNAFGKDVIKSYLKLKRTELSNFKRKEVFNKRKPITHWERANTLDC
jgi:glutamine synthetase